MELIKETSKNIHVAVFPFPFTSHPIVMFHLVLNLASKAPNAHFSFFNTTKSNKSLLSKNSLNLPANILFYNLDNDSESEGLGMFQEMNRFAAAIPENFKRGIEAVESQISRKVTCFLTDAMFCYHISSIAEDRKVNWIALWVPASYALPVFVLVDHIQKLYDNAEKPEDLIFDIVPGLSPIHYLDLPVREFVVAQASSLRDSPLNSLMLSMVQNIHRVANLVINSFQELNPDALIDHVKSKFQDVFFLGASTLSESPLSMDEDSTGCLSWLDKQKPESVVYINCGTAVGWPLEECSALAEALDTFGVPFLWTLKDETKGFLPSGFLDSVKGKFVAWAPQSRVLKHPSIGVYVTHCGYNSVLESALGGVPMICSSIWTDNHMTAKMVEEVWEIGVRVEGRKITKEGMIRSLETIFGNGKGKKIKENVSTLRQVLLKAAGPDGVAARDLNTLLHKILE